MSTNNTSDSIPAFFQSDLWIFTSTIVITYETVFWFCNVFLIFIELVDIPSIDQYRIQKKKEKLRFQPDMVRLMIKETIIHEISSILFSPVFYYIFVYFGRVNIHEPHPSWWTILFQLALFILSEDTLFFWTHYLFHTPWLYKNIHKKHHVYKQPTGVTAVLSDPVEAVQTLAAMWFMPVYLGNTHLFTLQLWVALRVYQTVLAHSGYNFPYISTQYWLPELMPGAIAHDFHHQQGKWNYGSFFSVWDQIMGTHRLKLSGTSSD